MKRTDTLPSELPDAAATGKKKYKQGHEQASLDSLVVPILPLVEHVVFPGAVCAVSLVGEEAALILEAAAENGGHVGLFLRSKNDGNEPTPDDLHQVGVLARLDNINMTPGGTLDAEAVGMLAVRLFEFKNNSRPLSARIEPQPAEAEPAEQLASAAEQTASLYRQLLSGNSAAEKLVPALETVTTADELAYLIAATIPISPQAKQELLEMTSASARLRRLDIYLRKSLELAAGASTGGGTATAGFAPDQPDIRLALAGLPPQAERVARREIERLATISPTSPDYNMVHSYVELLEDLPWQSSPEADIDLARARSVLDRDHYGVEEVKARIIEYLAVRKLRHSRKDEIMDISSAGATPTGPRQPVLCLVGPPGVGKTSMGASIAESLDRPFVRISLGGVSDEAEIRGHRRTYLGAMPGRIIQALVRAESDRPVILLDELDKLGPRSKGDPAAALLDLLDPEQQQHEFVDHYVDIPFDISCVLFIATANSLDTIPEALRDRLEIIELPGYTAEEKLQIAERHIVPRQMQWHALTNRDLAWRRDGLREIIESYTHEAGVRQLEREIATVCRKVATKIAEASEHGQRPFKADAPAVRELLGKPNLMPRGSEPPLQPGIATGLFWTPQGGEVMQIEVVMMPGSKTLTITGQLGEVMRESAQAALSYVRSRAEEFGIEPDFFEHNDMHIHIPSGAVAKDGPSAGTTIACALISLLTDKTLPADLAMTGELTLRGRVLPVGGIKEKLLAARRSGFKRVMIPADNRFNLDDVQPELLRGLEVLFAATMEDVLDTCFVHRGRRNNHPAGSTTRQSAEVAGPKESKAAAKSVR